MYNISTGYYTLVHSMLPCRTVGTLQQRHCNKKHYKCALLLYVVQNSIYISNTLIGQLNKWNQLWQEWALNLQGKQSRNGSIQVSLVQITPGMWAKKTYRLGGEGSTSSRRTSHSQTWARRSWGHWWAPSQYGSSCSSPPAQTCPPSEGSWTVCMFHRPKGYRRRVGPG